MVEPGRLFTCDRCKEQAFVSDSDTDYDGYNKSVPDKWYQVDYAWILCPNCNDQFLKFMKNEGDVHDKSQIHNRAGE